MCVTVVQWSSSCLNVQTPGDAVFCFFVPFFFFLFGLFFSKIFFLLAFFSLFLLLTLLVMHLDQYIF